MTTVSAPTAPSSSSWGAGRALQRSPVTLGLALTVTAVALLSGRLLRSPSPDALTDLGVGVGRPLWHLLPASVWCTGPLSWLTAVALALAVGRGERRVGSRVVLVALIGGQVLSIGVGLGLIRLLAATGDVWARRPACWRWQGW